MFLLFLFLFGFFLLLFSARISNFAEDAENAQRFFTFFDLVGSLSHLFEPILVERFDQDLDSDFFISRNIRKS